MSLITLEVSEKDLKTIQAWQNAAGSLVVGTPDWPNTGKSVSVIRVHGTE